MIALMGCGVTRAAGQSKTTALYASLMAAASLRGLAGYVTGTVISGGVVIRCHS